MTPQSNQTATVALAAFDRAGTILSEYMTPEELAGELGICKRTLDRWHAGRTGPPRVTSAENRFIGAIPSPIGYVVRNEISAKSADHGGTREMSNRGPAAHSAGRAGIGQAGEQLNTARTEQTQLRAQALRRNGASR